MKVAEPGNHSSSRSEAAETETETETEARQGAAPTRSLMRMLRMRRSEHGNEPAAALILRSRTLRAERGLSGGLGAAAAIFLTGLVVAACDGPNIDGKVFRCQTHADCGPGYQCLKQLGGCVAADTNRNGVFSDRLVFGMSAAFDEKTAIGALGTTARLGIQTMFNKVNKQGGVFGRRLELITEDDAYDPVKTASVVQRWIAGDNRQIFALLGVIGTETSLAARGVVTANKVLFYAPATGYEGLEPDPPDRYVFNVRVRYAEESEQLTAYALQQLRIPPENVAIYGQGTEAGGGRSALDAFGLSGFNGVRQALGGQISDDRIQVVSYKAKTADASAAIGSMLHWLADADRKAGRDGTIPVAVTIAALADAAGAFVCGLEGIVRKAKLGAPLPIELGVTSAELERLSKLDLHFLSLSAVGEFLPRLIASACQVATPSGSVYLGVGTIVAQPVPDPLSNASGVIDYREQLESTKPDASPDPISLEGYSSTALLVEGLKKHGPDLTVESFIDTLETLDVDLGIGTRLTFSSTSHQAMHKLWAVQINDKLAYEPVGVLGN